MDKFKLNKIFFQESKFEKDNNVKELKELENKLGVKFSKSLKKYVLHYMYKIPDCLDMYNYLLGDYKTKYNYDCLYKTTIQEREWGNWDKSYVIFADLGTGDFFAINCKNDKVVLLNHETMKTDNWQDNTLVKFISKQASYNKSRLSKDDLIDLKYIIKGLR